MKGKNRRRKGKKKEKYSLASIILIGILGVLVFGWLMSFVHLGVKQLASDIIIDGAESQKEIQILSSEIIKNKSTDAEKIQSLAAYTKKIMSTGKYSVSDNPNAWKIIEEAIHGKKGACGYQARVLAAMAKSQGYETRIIALRDYGHILTEIKIDNKWVLVDSLQLGMPEDTVGNHFFIKNGTFLNAKQIAENPDVIPDSAKYDEDYFKKIHYDTFTGKSKYHGPDYLYGREWAYVDTSNKQESAEFYKEGYSGIENLKMLYIFPFYIRFSVIMKNIPIVLHFDIFLIIGLLIILLLRVYKKIKNKTTIILSATFSVLYLASQVGFWYMYYNGIIR